MTYITPPWLVPPPAVALTGSAEVPRHRDIAELTGAGRARGGRTEVFTVGTRLTWDPDLALAAVVGGQRRRTAAVGRGGEAAR
ncbi:hypothetical protein ACFRI7_36020 [Streptomyces sp. NPDC056716]|uniref:hypothetical protein n=1 Tax=unclassified Streptomyces TaxID=2593676 RepID=UPI0036AA1977